LSRAAAFQFLCDCLAWPEGAIEPQSLRRIAESKSFKWTSFVAVAYQYRVAPAVPFALQKLELRDALPRGMIDYFDGLATTMRRQNAQVLDHAIELAEILNVIGVTPVLLKGGANLLRGLYPDPAMRVMTDLDILVPAERIDDCVACLRDKGFQPLTDYRYPRGHHYPPLGRPDSPLPIELHHQVLAHPYNRFLTADEVYETAIVLDGYDASIAVPSATCSVIHNIAHAQLSNHDYLYGRIDLRSLFDFTLLSRAYMSEIDWGGIGRHFSSRGGGTALNFHLLCARDLLRTRIAGLDRSNAVTRLLYRRARYLAARPTLLDLCVRLIRPWLLLRRELSDPALRRRLARNVTDRAWWARHLTLLAGRR
jgi:hypothetical protein